MLVFDSCVRASRSESKTTPAHHEDPKATQVIKCFLLSHMSQYVLCLSPTSDTGTCKSVRPSVFLYSRLSPSPFAQYTCEILPQGHPALFPAYKIYQDRNYFSPRLLRGTESSLCEFCVVACDFLHPTTTKMMKSLSTCDASPLRVGA